MSQIINTLKKFSFLRQHQQFGFIRCMCNYNNNKDLTQIQPTVNTDLLLQNLKNATNTKIILDMVSQHSPIMNNKHIMQALRSLFTLQKHGNSDISTKQILKHSEFGKLCNHLKSHAGVIELNETIEALKIVSYVGVPSQSTIVQVLLQLIRHNINSLSLQQIVFLDFLLNHFDQSPLVDAIKMALPIIFDINLPVKMDLRNINQLSDYLHYASKSNVSDKSIELLIETLLMSELKFNTQIAKSIIWSICDMKSNEFFEPILKKALKVLTENLDQLNFSEIETTLIKLVLNYSKKCPFYYDETFFDSCANYVIDRDLGYQSGVYLLRKFCRINYLNSHLLDYISTKLYENPKQFENADITEIYSIVLSAGMTDFRPIYWDHLRELILNKGNIVNNAQRDIIWIKFGTCLCLLDMYKIDVLNKCLNETFLDILFKKKFMSDIENYITIWQSITMYKPELKCMLPTKYTPEILLKRLLPKTEYPLEGALQKALGGENYVRTCVFTKCGHQIDHLVLFRKGGYPVALNVPVGTLFIEDIEIPSDSQTVVILGLEHYNYTLNNKKMLANTLFSMKLLESKGYAVIPVCLDVWKNLLDFEKIPYLMQAIKNKIDSEVLENVI